MTDAELGKIGVKKTEEFLRAHGYDVENVEDNADYWNIDVDLVVNGRIYVEVKTQQKLDAPYKSLLLEVTTCNGVHGKDGWFTYSEADFYAFYAPAVEKLFMCSSKKLKEAVEKYDPPIKKIYNGSTCYDLPYDKIEGLKIFNIKDGIKNEN